MSGAARVGRGKPDQAGGCGLCLSRSAGWSRHRGQVPRSRGAPRVPSRWSDAGVVPAPSLMRFSIARMTLSIMDVRPLSTSGLLLSCIILVLFSRRVRLCRSSSERPARRLPAALPDDQDGAMSIAHHRLGDAAHRGPPYRSQSPAAHDYEARSDLLGEPDDLSVGASH
jgi:hypothetical protein